MGAHGRNATPAWLAAATGLLLLTTARRGQAQDLDLVWQAPDACPTSEQVKSEFQRSLRLSPGYVPPRLSATAIVEHTGGRWFLHLHTVRNGIAGDREIEADSCASLGRAAALVLTLALGEGDLDQAPKPEPPPSKAAPSPPVEATPIAPAPQPAPQPKAARKPMTWAPTVDARTAWGPLRGPAFGVGAGVDVRATWWALSARAESWPTVSEVPAPGLEATFEGAGGALSFCVLGSPASFLVVALCGGMEASAIRGASSGGTQASSRVAPWYAALTSLRARAPLFDGVHLEVGFELAESLTRPEFTVDGLGDVYVVPELSPSAVVGVSFDL